MIDGPHGDIGFTDRKAIIDTCRGWGAHDGGVFSGKDPTMTDGNGTCMVRGSAWNSINSGRNIDKSRG